MITVTMTEEQAYALLDVAGQGLEEADALMSDDAKLDRAEEAMALVRTALGDSDDYDNTCPIHARAE